MLVVAVLLLLGVLLLRSGVEGGEPAAVAVTAERVRTVRPVPRPPPAPLLAPTLSTVPDEAVASALELVAPITPQLRCEVSGMLEDGVYETRPPLADHPVVRQGVLTVVLHEPAGRVRLERRLEQVATLTWEEGMCTVSRPRMTTVSGTLSWPDGSPAVGHEVRACQHGEFATTDEAGRWSMPAVVGSTCHPMAFVETADGSFGKSNVVDVEVDADGVDGVALSLPDALWTPAQQEVLVGQLVQMMDQRLASQQDRLDQLIDARDRASSEEERVYLQGLLDNEQLWVDWIAGELERFEDPEEQYAAFRDAWLNLY